MRGYGSLEEPGSYRPIDVNNLGGEITQRLVDGVIELLACALQGHPHPIPVTPHTTR